MPCESAPTTIQFHSCDNTTGFTKTAVEGQRTVDIITSGAKEGSGWVKTTVTKQAELLDISLSTPLNANVLTMSNAHLVFWFYVSEDATGDDRWATYADKIKARVSGNGRIEISSGGGNKGIYWKTADVFKTTCPIVAGWNKIDLKFSDAQTYGDSFTLNFSAIDWFRVYWEGPVALYDTFTLGFDDIYLYAE